MLPKATADSEEKILLTEEGYMVLMEVLISHSQVTIVHTEVNYDTMFTPSGGEELNFCEQSALSERSI